MNSKSTDKYYDFSSDSFLQSTSYNKEILIHTSDFGDKDEIPWFGRFWLYVFLSVLGFGWIQRIFLIRSALRVEIIMAKVVLK